MVESSDVTARSRELALQFYDYFCTFDPTVYEHLVEPNAYYKVGHEEYFGHEGFATVAKIAKFLYPNGMEPEITDVVAEGYKVALKVTTRAVTNKGADYENYYSVHFLFSAAGRVAELNEFPDTAYALEKFSHEGIEDVLTA